MQKNTIKIKELLDKYSIFENEDITIKAWIRNKRVGKNISFLTVNDGSAFENIQIVYKDLENILEINNTHIGSAIEVNGEIKLTPGRNNGFEIQAKNIAILGASSNSYPIQPKKHTYEFLRDIPHLRMRTNTFNAVFKIRSLLAYAVHSYFQDNDFVYVNTPILTSIDAEGAGEMFQVTNLNLENIPKSSAGEVDYTEDFFNKEVNLTVSGQLLAESYALNYGNVYTFGPTFRAEHSNTTRHAAEFWMIEPEMAFVDLQGNIRIAEELLKYVIKYALSKGSSELKFLNSLVEYDLIERLEHVVNSEFIVIDYKKALDVLNKAIKEGHKFENEVYFGVDLATEHEKYLTDVKYVAPVFVTNYPKEIKAFYMRANDDNKTVAAMDLLVPGIGELIGGSQREERIDVLQDLMKAHNINEEEYEWYLELRKYGGVVHSGFGIGFERLVMYVTGMENIRDVISFPRIVKNCKF